jgi:hypothetical protein
MHEDKSLILSTNSKKTTIYKSLFRFPTMIELKKAMEYKKTTSKDPSDVTKTLRFSKRPLEESCTNNVENIKKGFQTPQPLKAVVEVKNNVLKDIEVNDETCKDNSLKVRIVIANY